MHHSLSSSLKTQIYRVNLVQTFSVDEVQIYKSYSEEETVMLLFSLTQLMYT